MSGIEKLLKALVESRANFIVVGAYAAIMHGSALRTDDQDLCYERTPANYKKIIRAIAAFHPRPRGLSSDLKAPFDERSLAQGTNFILTTDLGVRSSLIPQAPEFPRSQRSWHRRSSGRSSTPSEPWPAWYA